MSHMFNKASRRVKRYRLLFDSKTDVIAVCIFLAIGLGIMNILYMSSSPPIISPKAYESLLNTIAKGESRDNYNAYFGNAGNTELRLTQMSVGEVLHWQEAYVKSGSPSSAVGRYQIIRPTLLGLVEQLKVDHGEIFDEMMQDKMAITLLERRGSVEFVHKKLSRDEFAASIAREWAALPKVIGNNPEQSYYASDGLNKSNITINEVYDALEQFKLDAQP